MPVFKFSCKVTCSASGTIEVEADNEEAAADMAYQRLDEESWNVLNDGWLEDSDGCTYEHECTNTDVELSDGADFKDNTVIIKKPPHGFKPYAYDGKHWMYVNHQGDWHSCPSPVSLSECLTRVADARACADALEAK